MFQDLFVVFADMGHRSFKWLKFTQFDLFTPLFVLRKQLCNRETCKKYEKRAFRVEISTFVSFEIGSVYTITAGLP